MKRLKIRARLEFAAAVLAAILGMLTSFGRDWIEALTGWDPDQHSGGGEWIIVPLLLMVSVVVGLAGRRNWKLAAANSCTFGLRQTPCAFGRRLPDGIA